MFGLLWIDIIVIVAYFLVLIGIGYWSMRRIRHQEDYFLGGRRFGRIVQIFAAFGSGTSADTAVGVTTTTFRNGISGIWSALLGLFVTPFYWIVAPWMRRLRLLTMGDFFEERYQSQKMAGLYALFGCIGFIFIIALGMSAMSKTIVGITPKTVEELNQTEFREYQRALEREHLQELSAHSMTTEQLERLEQLNLERPRKLFSHINEDVLIWIVGLIVILYAVTGGLEAAFLADLIQGMFIIFLSIIFLPFAWTKISNLYGGSNMFDAFGIMHQRLPESFFQIFTASAANEFTWYYILSIALMAGLGVTVQPNMLVTCGAAKSENAARVGFTSGNFMKRFCTILWGLFGLTAVVLYSGVVDNSDLIWGHATRDLLGSAKIGLVGLMVASLMAALMSTVATLMISASGLIIHNLYRPFFPERNEQHYVKVGRVIGFLVVVGGALGATMFDTILQMLKFVWGFFVMYTAAFWLGIKWRRATRKAAWASIITSLIISYLLPTLAPVVVPAIRTTDYFHQMTEAKTLTQTVEATQYDVSQRNQEIRQWERTEKMGDSVNTRPHPLTVGQQFEKVEYITPKSVFWTQGVKIDDRNRKYGAGEFNVSLVLLSSLGWDLRKNPHALNETINVLFRTLLPFLILLLFGIAASEDDKQHLDRFFVKMRTKVNEDPAIDRAEIEKSYRDLNRFEQLKLFPNSSWEFLKWNREDASGFIVSVGVVVGIIGLLYLLVSIGK
ncbi:sodium:solute symporter family protein [candidate division KSB1 bacterium]|nr:sodium:solute symporter family protein [candidate division KSB1 bacterium]